MIDGGSSEMVIGLLLSMVRTNKYLFPLNKGYVKYVDVCLLLMKMNKSVRCDN